MSLMNKIGRNVVKVLITGHKGFIGSRMYTKLKDLGHEVMGFDYSEGSGFPDVSEQNLVMHFGAISDTTEKDIEKLMIFNHDFSCQLFMACNQAKVDLQYCSSASVYGNTNGKSIEPLNGYAWTKYLFDRLVEKNLEAKSWPIKVQGFRLFNVWGKPMDEKHKGDQASLFTKFYREEKVKLFEGSENIYRDFIHVEDVVDIMFKMIYIEESGIFDTGTGQQRSFMDIGKAIVNDPFYRPNDIEIIPFPEKHIGSYQYSTKCNNAPLMELIEKQDFIMPEHPVDADAYSTTIYGDLNGMGSSKKS